MPDDGNQPPPPLTRAALLAYLGRVETIRMVQRYVARKLPEDAAEERAQDVLEAAVEAEEFPATEQDLPPWLHGIADHKVADWLRKRARRRKYEGRMPEAPAVLDEAGLPVEDPGDAVVDIDPRHDPEQEDPRFEGMLLVRFMKGALEGQPEDAKIWRIMQEHAETGRKLQDLATENGMSPSQLSRKMHELRDKYEPRYRRWRNSAIILLVLGLAAVVLVAVLVWRSVRTASPENALPDPAAKPLVPPSAAPAPSTEPTEEPFNQAAPTDGGSGKKL